MANAVGNLARLFQTPRKVLGMVFLACLGMLSFGLYLQMVVGLEPCPMCIVQRYALIFVALSALFAGISRSSLIHTIGSVSMTVWAMSGAYVAARQTWLQWYPPEVVSCGRDLYGMIESFPLQRAIPMIFRGSGDCSQVDWTFLGGSIANWSFVCFCGFSLVGLALVFRQKIAPLAKS
ncbi:MAG: hypothetical protein RLZZ495_884 [Pseudomonadota bacterium]|jgi:disulfide bond formation protein DsbB